MHRSTADCASCTIPLILCLSLTRFLETTPRLEEEGVLPLTPALSLSFRPPPPLEDEEALLAAKTELPARLRCQTPLMWCVFPRRVHPSPLVCWCDVFGPPSNIQQRSHAGRALLDSAFTLPPSSPPCSSRATPGASLPWTPEGPDLGGSPPSSCPGECDPPREPRARRRPAVPPACR